MQQVIRSCIIQYSPFFFFNMKLTFDSDKKFLSKHTAVVRDNDFRLYIVS